MASTYSQNLKIELMGTGDQVDSWGDTTNDNLGTAIEEAIVGYGAVQFTNDANLTLTLANSNDSQTARKFFFYVTSTVSLSTQRDLIVPTSEKTYTVHNNTTGGQAIRVKTSAGTGVVVPSGKKMILYANGTNVIEQMDYATSLAVGTLNIDTPLPVASGGTGASTAANARTNLGLGSIATQSASSVAITGGSITGITDLAVADGGTGASTAADARTNLGAAASGANSDITSLAGLTTALSIAQGGTGASDASGARTNLGLGTIATQSASSVTITGGSITGITDLAVADGGTGASTAADARTNLGLGTIATQSASSVAITGGSITGITDLAVADGGTGASTAADARTNLGLGTMATQSASSVAITGGSITGVTGINTLGDGQTWQNVTGSRTTGVAYSNTTGRTIFVATSALASVASTTRDSTFLVNGVVYAYSSSSNNSGTDGQSHNYFMPIPAGATYQLNTSGGGSFTINYWSELR